MTREKLRLLLLLVLSFSFPLFGRFPEQRRETAKGRIAATTIRPKSSLVTEGKHLQFEIRCVCLQVNYRRVRLVFAKTVCLFLDVLETMFMTLKSPKAKKTKGKNCSASILSVVTKRAETKIKWNFLLFSHQITGNEFAVWLAFEENDNQQDVFVCVSRFVFCRPIFSADCSAEDGVTVQDLRGEKRRLSPDENELACEGEPRKSIRTRNVSFDLSSVCIQEIITRKERPDYQ